MAEELLSSKVVVVEEEPTVRGIADAPTSVAGAVGVTERGPIGKALLCTSFEEFQAQFGGFTADSDLALAAEGFFENGGSDLWVVRTTHYQNIADPDSSTAVKALGSLVAAGGGPTPAELVSSKGPFALADGDRIVLTVNGTDAVITFTGAPASVASAAAEPFIITDGETLTVRVDGGVEQTVVFSVATLPANPSAEVVAELIAQSLAPGGASAVAGRVVLSSGKKGNASRIQVTGGTANGALGFSTVLVGGAGNVADLSAVTEAEVKAIIEAATREVGVSDAA